MSNNTILQDYYAELAHAQNLKAQGVEYVLVFKNKKQMKITIDEDIKHWQDGIKAMEAGADPKQYNF